MANGVVISKLNAYTCAVVSAFGIVFLLIVGILYMNSAYTLTKGKHNEHIDPEGTGAACLIAAALYVLSLLGSVQQIYAHRRNSLQLH